MNPPSHHYLLALTVIFTIEWRYCQFRRSIGPQALENAIVVVFAVLIASTCTPLLEGIISGQAGRNYHIDKIKKQAI